MKDFRKIIALALVFVTIFSFSVVPAVAYDYEPVSGWSLFLEGLDNWFTGETGHSVSSLESNLILPYTGEVTMSQLESARDYYNSWINVLFHAVDATPSVNGTYAVITYVPADNIYRLIDDNTSQYIVDYLGRFPYVEGENGGDVPAETLDTSEDTLNKWVDPRSVSYTKVVVLSYDVLAQAAYDLNNGGVNCSLIKVSSDLFWAISRSVSAAPLYCNSSGYVYVASVESNATDIDYDYIDNSNNTTITDSQIIDVTDGVLNIINENGETKTLTIDSLTFDFSDHSYTVNAYDIVFDNDIYTFNYYTYNISYTYNYTYVNYIGSTSEYKSEEYVLYYELPDGRSSADLTADEIAGMALDFDVVNYDIAYADTQTMALYHFDGTWENESAYTDYSLTWSKSSITYLDSNAYGGAIYLDGSNHSFNSIPSVNSTAFNAATDQFTLQFRMYIQDAGGTDYSYIGAQQAVYGTSWSNYPASCLATLFQGKLYWGMKTGYDSSTYSSSSLITTLSFGTWNEICFSCIGTTIYCYVNGVKVGTVTTSPGGSSYESYGLNLIADPYNYVSTGYVARPLSFYDGVKSVKWTGFLMAFNLAYSSYTSSSGSPIVYNTYQTDQTKNPGIQLDNLRFVNTCLYTGAQYLPSVVPYETNLVLVLPDSAGFEDNTIAVMSEIPVTGYRMGGVRPTFPRRGLVWFAVESNRIYDCQIFNGSIWESVEGRIWTGTRYIPLWSFDLVTLQDLWDMSSAEDIVVSITTEYGFWNWWQSQWLDFREWMETNGVSGSGDSSVPSDPADTTFPGSEDEEDGWSFLDLLVAVKNGAWKVTTGTVGSFFGGIGGVVSSVVSVGDFYDAYDSGSPDNIFGITDYGGEDIWD